MVSNPDYIGGGGGEAPEPPSLDELYKIDIISSELFLKFSKDLHGFRLGLINLEFYNFQSNDYRAKMVVKPLGPERKWKF